MGPPVLLRLLIIYRFYGQTSLYEKTILRWWKEWNYGHMLTTGLRYAPPIVTKKSPCGPKVGPKLSKKYLKVVPKFSFSYPKVVSKMSPSGLQVVSNMYQFFPKVALKLYFLCSFSSGTEVLWTSYWFVNLICHLYFTWWLLQCKKLRVVNRQHQKAFVFLLKIVSKLAPSCLKVVTKFCRICPKVVSKLSPNGLQVLSNVCQSCPKIA